MPINNPYPMADIHYFAYKSAIQTVNNSNVFVADTHLFIPVLANEVWLFKFNICYMSHGIADIKFKLRHLGAAGTVFRAWLLGSRLEGIENNNWLKIGEPWSRGIGIADSVWCSIEGWAEVAAAPGTIKLQWAQQVANASDTSLLENSNVIAHRVK